MADTLKVFGPPGTGKTTRLLGILEEELRAGVHPDRIAYLTFTVKAREEAVERAQDVPGIGADDDALRYFKTLHALMYSLLEMNHAALLSSDEQLQEFGDRIGIDFEGAKNGAGSFGQGNGARLLAFDHYRRHKGLSLKEAFRRWPDPLRWFEVEFFAREYAKFKDREGYSDFTDLLENVDEVEPLDIDVAIVDEAQDLSRLQWRVFDRLTANAERVYIAGDDDQAIFEWAGASPDAFLNRPGDTEVLGRSYRLPRSVHRVANDLIGRIQGGRQGKEWEPRDEEGKVRLLPEVASLRIPEEGSVMVLYRNRYLARRVEGVFRDRGIPYRLQNGHAPGMEHAQGVIYWYRLRNGTRLPPRAVRRIFAAMREGGPHLGKGSRARLKRAEGDLSYEDARDLGLTADPDLPWFDALDRLSREERGFLRAVGRRHGAQGLVEDPRVRFSTIHGSKGGEADHVILLTDFSRKVGRTIKRTPDVERRVFYVGTTRARHTLSLVGRKNPFFFHL